MREPGGLGVVEEAWQRIISNRDIDTEDRDPNRGIGPVPLDDPVEETAQHPEALTDRVACRRHTFDGQMSGEEQLERFDVAAANIDEPGDVGELSLQHPLSDASTAIYEQPAITGHHCNTGSTAVRIRVRGTRPQQHDVNHDATL